MIDPLASLIEHTALAATTTQDDVRRLCADARQFGFGGVCVPPRLVDHARRDLGARSEIRLVTVAGFPLGDSTPAIKAEEARRAVSAGADHVDMVITIGDFAAAHQPDGGARSRADAASALEREIAEVASAIAARNPAADLKVILETGYLSPDAIAAACQIARRAGAQWVKTSTGFGPRGASLDDVRLMRAAVGGALKIKAAGGIRTIADLEAYAAAGVAAIGCSAGARIFADR